MKSGAKVDPLIKHKSTLEKKGFTFVSVVPLESASYLEVKTPHGESAIVKVDGVTHKTPAYRPSTTKRVPESLAKIATSESSHLTGVAVQHPETYYIKHNDEELNFSPKSTSNDQFKTVRVMPVVTMKEIEHDSKAVESNINKVTLYLQTEYIGQARKSEMQFELLTETLLEPAEEYFTIYDKKVAKLIRQLRDTKRDLSQNPSDKEAKESLMKQFELIDLVINQAYELSMMNEALIGMKKKFASMQEALDEI